MIVKSALIVMVVSLLMLTSCYKNNDTLNSTEAEIISSESLTEACMAEVSQMGIVIFSGITDSQLGSTLNTVPAVVTTTDSLLIGAIIGVSGTGGMNSPQGTVTIDFQSGTADRKGNVRTGKILINYTGRRWALGSTRTISFSGYSRNNVKVDDNTSYVITNLTANADSSTKRRNFRHKLKNCILTFPDHTIFSSDSAKFIARVNFVSKTTTLYSTDTCAIGTTRYNNQSFLTKITDSLIYEPQCISAKMFLPNAGEKSVTVGGSSIYTITYGSALTCSQTVKVKAGNKSATITVNADGN